MVTGHHILSNAVQAAVPFHSQDLAIAFQQDHQWVETELQQRRCQD